MAEKSSSDNADVSHAHDEKHGLQVPESQPAETAGGRRKSVALNIVENPLKVSFVIPDPPPPPVIITSFVADPLPSYSAPHWSNVNSMPGLLPSRTVWLSMPSYLVGLLSSRVNKKDSSRSLRLPKKSALRSSTRGITNGTDLSCFGIRSLYVQSEPLRKDGIRPDPTGRICPSLRNLVLTVELAETNGSSEPLMPSSS